MKTKAVLVGDSSVGKTSLYSRLDHKTFSAVHLPTVSGAYTTLNVTFGRTHMAEVGLWDTAGQERFRTIVPLYFQRAAIVIIVFSIVSRESFENVNTWYEMAQKHAPPTAVYLLVGNKSDLAHEREVGFMEAQEKSDSLKFTSYMEMSAATGVGCDDLMTAFAMYFEKENAEGRLTGEMAASVAVTMAPVAVPAEKSSCC
jgi:small GTP-binding protein